MSVVQRARSKVFEDTEMLQSPPSSKHQSQHRKIAQQQSEFRAKCTRKRPAVFSLILSGIFLCLMEVLYVVCYLENVRGYNSHMISHVAQNCVEVGIKRTLEQDDENEHSDPLHDKERILQILAEAGFNDHVDEKTLRELPTWSEVTSLYGEHPLIYGMDQCEVFQKRFDQAEHYLGAAGTFNSGTNLLSELLNSNCHIPARIEKFGAEANGMRWQVPWGKHNPPSDEEYRQTHKTPKDQGYNADYVLPVVTIRDPYFWMGSMCRIGYSALWPHTDQHCPNLVPSNCDKAVFPSLISKQSVQVNVRYSKNFTKEHDSLSHMWNDWYGDYVNAEFPRIIVRFEDLIFFAKETTESICKCAGGEMNEQGFRYIVSSAKGDEGVHGPLSKRTTFIDAMIKYGSSRDRFGGFFKDDLLFADKVLNHDLMEIFGYSSPPIRQYW